MLNKILVYDSGLVDRTYTLTDYFAGTVAVTLTSGTDKIYIGSKLPFLGKHIKVSVANATPAVMAVKYWDGTTFRSAVNVLDGTSPAATSLAQSGYVSWDTDKRYTWVADDTSIDGTEKVTGLGTLSMYEYYWIQITFDANVTGTLDWVGDLFCSDSELGAEFPDLNRTAAKEAWASGKTTWEEQRVIASKAVSQGLQALSAAEDAELVFNRDALSLACVQKTAEIIYFGLGEGYADSMDLAYKEYTRRMDRKFFVIDENKDGRANPAETQTVRVSRMRR